VTAVERHPPVIPTAVEGSLLLRASAAANLKILFPEIFRLRRNADTVQPPVQGGAKNGPLALCVAFQSEILNFKFEILFPEICRLRQQIKPIPPLPPKAGRRVGHPPELSLRD
jgi:hypothetical protein